MAAQPASRPFARPTPSQLERATPDVTEVRARVRQTRALPETLPKPRAALSFATPHLSQVRPLPEEQDDIELDTPEADTLLFRRSDPVPSAPTFAPPLPIPQLVTLEEPSSPSPKMVGSMVRRRALTATSPHTHRAPVLPRLTAQPQRYGPSRNTIGIAVLLCAAVLGAAVGWFATPYVYEQPPAATAE
jgi:hypothetical protein